MWISVKSVTSTSLGNVILVGLYISITLLNPLEMVPYLTSVIDPQLGDKSSISIRNIMTQGKSVNFEFWLQHKVYNKVWNVN